VFLKVYADESYDSGIYTCGAFIGWPKDFYYLGVKWDERLQKDNLRYFRASECEGLYGQFDPQNPPGYGLSQARARAESVRYDLIEIIKSDVIGGISISVSRKDFEDFVSKDLKAAQRFGTDILIYTYKTLITLTVELLEQDWPEYPKPKAAFLLDEHSNWQKAEEAYSSLKAENTACANRMLVIGHADDEEYPGLQMADLMAHESRLHTKAHIGNVGTERLMMRELKKKHNVYFTGLMQKEQLQGMLNE